MLECFLEVASLIRPRMQAWNFDLPLLVDKDILRSNVAHFAVKQLLHLYLGCREAEKKKPELALLEFRLSFFPILYLFDQ